MTHDVPFEPLEGYVLCEAPRHETTEGGLVLPETDLDDEEVRTPVKLRVVKVGPGELMDNGDRRPVGIEPGQSYYFIFPRYSLGAELVLRRQKYVIIQSKFVCGKAL